MSEGYTPKRKASKKAKKIKTSFASTNAALITLLAQIQDRVTAVQTELQTQIDRAWQLQESREGVAAKNTREFEKYGKNTTDSIYALRDSTAKAFSNVAKDIEAVKQIAQRLNERAGIAESKIVALETKAKVAEDFRRLLVETIKSI